MVQGRAASLGREDSGHWQRIPGILAETGRVMAAIAADPTPSGAGEGPDGARDAFKAPERRPRSSVKSGAEGRAPL
jgi:hypothetical protein